MTRQSENTGEKGEKKKGLLKRFFTWIGTGTKKASTSGSFCRT